MADLTVDALHTPFSAYILDETPAVLSVGVRCMEQGYSFVWPADGKPYFIRPDRKVILLNVDGKVPVIDSTCKVVGHQQFRTEHNLKKLFAMPSKSDSASEPPEEGINEGVPTDDETDYVRSRKSADLEAEARSVQHQFCQLPQESIL